MIGLTACEKEEVASVNQNDSLHNLAEFSENPDITKIKQNAIDSYHEMGNEGYIFRADKIRTELVNNGKLITYDKSSSDPIPLEELFFLYEGVINSIYTTQGDPEDESETVYSVFDIPVSQDENGNSFIQVDNFNDFYSNLITSLGNEVSTSANEYLVLTDLQLTNLESEMATVTATLVIAMHPARPIVAFYPIGCELAMSVGNPWDAGSHTRGYVNSTSDLRDPDYCDLVQNTSYNSYYFVNGDVPTNLSSFTFNYLYGLNPITALKPYLWRSATNDCIGDNNDQINNELIWYSLYSNASSVYNTTLRNALINSSFNIYPANELKFLYTSLHTYGKDGWETDPNINFSMGGKGYYGVIICR